MRLCACVFAARQVTNKKDKETQIPKLTELNEQVIALKKKHESVIRHGLNQLGSMKFNMASIRNSNTEPPAATTARPIQVVEDEGGAAEESSVFELSLPPISERSRSGGSVESAGAASSTSARSSVESAPPRDSRGERRSLPALYGKSFGEPY